MSLPYNFPNLLSTALSAYPLSDPFFALLLAFSRCEGPGRFLSACPSHPPRKGRRPCHRKRAGHSPPSPLPFPSRSRLPTSAQGRGGDAHETLPFPPTAAAKTTAGVGKGPFPTVSTATGVIALSPGVWRTLSRRLPAPKTCRGARSPRPTPGALPGRRAAFQQNRPCQPDVKFFCRIPLAEAALSHPNLQGREAVGVVGQPLACPSSWARSMQR